jgi:hypothetical protein
MVGWVTWPSQKFSIELIISKWEFMSICFDDIHSSERNLQLLEAHCKPLEALLKPLERHLQSAHSLFTTMVYDQLSSLVFKLHRSGILVTKKITPATGYLYSPYTSLRVSAISPRVHLFSTASSTEGIIFSPLLQLSLMIWRH